MLYLYANGEKTIELEIEEWYGVVDVPAGKYRYSYNACGGTQRGSVTVSESSSLLSLPICDGVSLNYSVKAEDMRSLAIFNRSGEAVQVSLVGPTNYQFTVSANKTSFEVAPGRYQANFTACGVSHSMALNLLNKDSQLNIPHCDTPETSRVKIQNNTDSDMVVYLNGPESQTFTVNPGTTRVDMAQGTYSFTVWSEGNCIKGTLEVANNVVVWSWWSS